MATNYEKYYGTPEKAAKMQHAWQFDPRGAMAAASGGFSVWRYDINAMDEPEEIAFVPCDHDDPAAMLGWLLQDAEK